MSEELKPCPFCGAKASVQRYSSGTGGPKCAVWCDACHVGTSWLHGDDGEARVVAEWNRRAPVAARELDVEAELRDALEVYAESYDMMARMKGGSSTVACTSVAYDIRRNMVDAVLQVVRAAHSAAQSTAPVSTEQAGDARHG